MNKAAHSGFETQRKRHQKFKTGCISHPPSKKKEMDAGLVQ